MNYKICVITSAYLHEPIKKRFELLSPECTLQLVTYKNFREIARVYDEWAYWADGFLVSGSMAKSAIEIESHQISRPIISFEMDMSGLYREILLLLTRNRHQDTGRICLDFLVPLTDDWSANYFLSDVHEDLATDRIAQWADSARSNQDTLHSLEDSIKHKILRAYQEDRMDVVISQYTNLIPFYEDHNIPFEYPFPTLKSLEAFLHSLFLQIEMNRLRSTLPALISCTYRDPASNTSENLKKLAELVNAFLKENLLTVKAECCDGQVQVKTTLQPLRTLTQDEQVCALEKHLGSYLNEPVCIGYGYSTSQQDARQNAFLAREESRLSGGSFVCNEQGTLTGPLNSRDRIRVVPLSAQNLGRIAKQCKLSAVTIQKLVTYIQVSGSNKVTTRELAERFGVSIRNANRIIQNLEEGGCAKLGYTQTNGTKGRPVKVYTLDFQHLIK